MNFELKQLTVFICFVSKILFRFIKIIDGHLPFNLKKLLVINLNLTGKFFWASVIHFFDKDFIDKLELYSRDVKAIGRYIDERVLNVQFPEASKMDIDFKQDFAQKVFNFYGYKYEEDETNDPHICD